MRNLFSRYRLSSWIVAVSFILVAISVAVADSRSRSLAFNTLKLVAGTLAISMPVGILLGLLIARTDLPLRRLAAMLLGLLVVVPLYLQAAAWQAGFGLFGWYMLAFGEALQSPWLAGWRAAIFVHGLAATPWVALIVGLAARQIEPQLEEAALLDASAWRVVTNVTMPRILPAIGLAAIWVSLLAATDMTVTDLFQVRTYAEEVYVDFAAPVDISSPDLGPWAGAMVVSALAGGAILICASATHLSARLLPTRPLRFALGPWRWPTAFVVDLLLTIGLGVPLLNVIYKAGVVVEPAAEGVMRSWSAAKCLHIVGVSPARYKNEIGMSALIALGAAAMTMVFALPLSWMARRGGAMAFPAVAVAAVALAIPAPLLGIALIHVLNNPSMPWLEWMYHTIGAPIVGQSIRALPLTIFIAWFAFRTIPEEQFEAAAIDGAVAWRQFWHVAVPQRWLALFGAWAAALVTAFNELPITLLLQPPGTMTAPVAIYQLMHGNGEDRLAGIVLAMTLAYAAIGLICIGFVHRFRGRIIP